MNLTSIKLTVNGAQAWATVTGPLTSGMVGLPVTIEYDDAWDGLTKNLVCRCSPWGSDDGEIRTILNVGETAVVAHEVMQAGMYLHLGVEGFCDDGTQVMPTTWARCKDPINPGANTGDDLSADPTLPIWGQLQAQIGQLDRDGIPQETLDEVLRCAEAAVQAQKAAEAAAERAEAAADSGGYGALVTDQINALDGMFKAAAYNTDSGYAAAYAAFRSAFGLAASEDPGEGDVGEESGGSNESTWTDGVAYTYEVVENEYVETNGAFTAYNGWNRTPYLYCKGAAVLRAVVNIPTIMLTSNNTYNAFYDESKNFISGFNCAVIDSNTAGAYKDIEIPADAAYFVASHKSGVIGGATVTGTYNALGFVPYSEVPV